MTAKGTTRRGFLRQAGIAAAGAVGFPYIVKSSALGLAGQVAPSERIVMGCIGLGGQGTYNLQNFMGQPGVQIAALCDVERASNDYWGGDLRGWEPAKKLVEDYYAEKSPSGQYKGCAVYTDFRELLARDDIDAVTVCTPDHWHGLISVAAAQAGKDIYCEKPLANTVAEGRAVCKAVKRYGRILQTGSHERSRDNARYACELVRNGRLGKLHTIRVNLPVEEPHHKWILQNDVAWEKMAVPEGFDYDTWLGPTPHEPYTRKRCHFWWRFILNYGGGEMTDRGAHVIDLAQLGNDTDATGPVEIEGHGKQPGRGLFDAFMDYQFELTYADGVGLFGRNEGPRGVKFEGSAGWVFIHVHGGNLEAQPPALLQEIIGPEELHLGRSRGHQENFIETVRTRRETLAPAEVGHRTGSICHLVNIAMLLGRKLKWDPVKEEIVNDPEADRMLARPMRSPWSL